jgi:ferredoxin
MASDPESAPKRVRCVINGEEIDVWEGYRLWDAALDARAKLWHVCGGKGECTTCAVIVVSGSENLSQPTPHERLSLGQRRFPLKLLGAGFLPLRFLWWVKKRWKGRPVRLACESYVKGPVEVVGLFGKKSRQAREKAARAES